MKTKIITSSIAAFLLTISPAHSDEIVVIDHGDGSYTVQADIEDLGKFAGNSIATVSNFAVSLGKAFGADTRVDFSEGHVLQGPVSVSIARPDGSVALYTAKGRIVAYDSQDTFTETRANFSLQGVIVFEDAKGRIVANHGTISLIKR